MKREPAFCGAWSQHFVVRSSFTRKLLKGHTIRAKNWSGARFKGYLPFEIGVFSWFSFLSYFWSGKGQNLAIFSKFTIFWTFHGVKVTIKWKSWKFPYSDVRYASYPTPCQFLAQMKHFLRRYCLFRVRIKPFFLNLRFIDLFWTKNYQKMRTV